KLSEAEQTTYGVSYPIEKQASGVFLRSSKIGNIKGSNQPKVQAALHELAIPARLTMYTAKTCAKMDELNQTVSTVIDARKLVDRLEQELRVEKARLDNLNAVIRGA